MTRVKGADAVAALWGLRKLPRVDRTDLSTTCICPSPARYLSSSILLYTHDTQIYLAGVMSTLGSPGQKPPLRRQRTPMASSSSAGSPHHTSTPLLRTASSSSLTSKKAKARLVKRPSAQNIPLSHSHSELATSLPESSTGFSGFGDLKTANASLNPGMPRLTRHSTYSSLPPSPRLQAALDLGIDPLDPPDRRGATELDEESMEVGVGHGIGAHDLERALGGLVDSPNKPRHREKDRPKGLLGAAHVRSESDIHALSTGGDGKSGRRRTGSEESDDSIGAGLAGSDHGDTEVDEVEEEFWPARSRRPTLESRGSGRYGRGGPPGLNGMTGMTGLNGAGSIAQHAGYEEGLSSPTSPTSPPGGTHWTASSGDESKPDGRDDAGVQVGGMAGLWDILTDEAGEEAWDGWVADGKW